MEKIRIIDSHTGGEPTRVVFDDPLPLLLRHFPRQGDVPAADAPAIEKRLRLFHPQYDALRRAVACEPRGSDVLVGAVLCPAMDASCIAGVIFFNNVGFLNMCGHATIGVAITLAHLGRISPGTHRLETRVGVVSFTLGEDGSVSLENVPSFRKASGISVDVPGHGTVTGDVAWGGNWFFITENHGQQLELEHVGELSAFASALRRAVNEPQHFPDVDHIELVGPPSSPNASARGFVLCPGGVYDRSACGTGTSAKLACLAADGKLAEGEEWVQESIIGSTFKGSYRWHDRDAGAIIPIIVGEAHVTTEGEILLNPHDPFCWGIS
ncbi:4-hydroxyproline epimerase [Roseimicrobium gellanilyticum]|uniref:4-hydroxyproline epimerase n=1 Tax=Roseimicrobium gellanilyticum TaxID=748857 RepID=A0A366HUM8_9BACT|nr:4-hydroxyproline epimerase [Roseimicrobium gellanilyticum]